MVLTPEMLRCYVPKFLASRFLARPAPADAPGMERFPAAVLFADICGFTPLAERLAQRGRPAPKTCRVCSMPILGS
jgi:class 3 adenylate cyclase